MQIPFVGPTYEGRSKNFDASRCINFFPELAQDPNQRSVGSLIGTPGTKLFYDFLTDHPARLIYNFNDRLFAVINTGIYEFDNNDNPVLRASGIDGSGLIVAADNGESSLGVGGDQIILVIVVS